MTAGTTGTTGPTDTTGTTVQAAGIAVSDPRTDPRWLELARGPLGNLFVSPPWISAVCDTYGFEPVCRMALRPGAGPDGDRAIAGLAWVPVRDMCGERVLALPFSDHATPPVADARAWPALVEGIARPEVPFTLRCFADSVPARAGDLRRTGAAAWHGTAVGTDPDALFARLSGHARRNVRIAERGGVVVETSTGIEAVRRFHTLHRTLRTDKYRLLAQPLALFERIWEAFAPGDAIVTALARAGDEVVAGAVFLVWGDVLYYKFGASLREHLALRPNDAVFWAGLRLAVERGLRLLDWGLSDLDQPGLVAYKRKWAPEERTIVTLRSGGEAAPDVTE
ncbi:MAG TPA: GNAT family N-acetyltransferase, partial [Pseudonocardia sp.]|nr:GNAT family N-acetyltransferase [Pseudonocardia sp.]